VLGKTAHYPAVFIALVLVLSLGAIHVLQVVRQVDLYYVAKMGLGFDYQDFYEASQQLDGGSPYDVKRYATPPLPAILNYPLSRLPFDHAKILVFGLILVSVIISYTLVNKIFFRLRDREAITISLCGLVTMMFSYPLLFLLDRGNIDAFVILLLCAGLFLMRKNDLLAGLVWGVAMSMKVYPIIILLPTIANRRFKTLAGSVVPPFVSILVGPGLWAQFARRIVLRADTFRVTENGSIANTFVGLGKFLRLVGVSPSRHSLIVLSMTAYVLLLALMVIADYRRHKWKQGSNLEQLAEVMMYFPFMVAIPKVAYHYGLVILIPMIPMFCYLWNQNHNSGAEKTLLIAILGIALSQIQAVALERLFDTILPHFIPGFGLFLVMIGCVLYKLCVWPGPRSDSLAMG